ncbi:MAG: hypothetical protein R2857_10585 [Vampirovibrionales bacterium]
MLGLPPATPRPLPGYWTIQNNTYVWIYTGGTTIEPVTPTQPDYYPDPYGHWELQNNSWVWINGTSYDPTYIDNSTTIDYSRVDSMGGTYWV